MRGYLVIVLSLAGALVCAPATTAAPSWGPEDTISPYGWGAPSPAVDSKGNAVVAFSGDFLAVSTRAAGRRFSPPTGLFSASEAKAGIAEDGWAAVAGRGPAPTPSHGGQYLVSLRPPGGQFRAPVALGVTESPGHVWNFAVGPDGTMALAYPAGDGFAIHVRKPGQESFSSAQVVPSDWQIYLDPPRIVIDGTGRVLVFWATYAGPSSTPNADRATRGSPTTCSRIRRICGPGPWRSHLQECSP